MQNKQQQLQISILLLLLLIIQTINDNNNNNTVIRNQHPTYYVQIVQLLLQYDWLKKPSHLCQNDGSCQKYFLIL